MFETQGGTRNRTRDRPKKGSAFITSSDHWTLMCTSVVHGTAGVTSGSRGRPHTCWVLLSHASSPARNTLTVGAADTFRGGAPGSPVFRTTPMLPSSPNTAAGLPPPVTRTAAGAPAANVEASRSTDVPGPAWMVYGWAAVVVFVEGGEGRPGGTVAALWEKVQLEKAAELRGPDMLMGGPAPPRLANVQPAHRRLDCQDAAGG